MTKMFKNSYFGVDLDSITLKRNLLRGIVIPNTCVKLYRNRIINEGTRALKCFFFIKIATVTLSVALERLNSNLS